MPDFIEVKDSEGQLLYLLELVDGNYDISYIPEMVGVQLTAETEYGT